MTEVDYIGSVEQVYTGYLTVASDGTVSAFVATPGMPPVVIRRAGGNDALPEIPGDGLCVPVKEPLPASAKKGKSPPEPAQPGTIN